MMNNRITLAVTADPKILEGDDSYLHLLSVLNGLNYQVELVGCDFGDTICGVINTTDKKDEYQCDAYPRWLPVIARSQLSEPERLENYLVQVIALAKLNEIKTGGFNKSALIAFHSHYKLLLLAYSQPDYRKIGPFVANADGDNFATAFEQYQHMLIAILAQQSNVKNHINVLQHIQGYFRPYLTSVQKKCLAKNIDRYRRGILPLLLVIDRLVEYLDDYPNSYLSGQYYLTEYPQILALCYGDIRCRV